MPPIVAPQALDLIRCMVASTTALLRGQSAAPVLRTLDQSLSNFPQSSVREPLKPFMRLVPLEDSAAANEIPVAQVARALIETGERLAPLVGSTEQDMLQYMGKRLKEIAAPAAENPVSGLFRRGDAATIMDSIDSKDSEEWIERQASEALLLTGGGAIHDASNTLAVMQGTQALLNRRAEALCRLEAEFAGVTPIGSSEGRVDLIESVLEPVARMGGRLETVLENVREMHRLLRQSAGNVDEAGKAVRRLAAPRGLVFYTRSKVVGLRADVSYLLLTLRRSDLQRWADRECIEEDVRTAYDGHLAALRGHLEEMRDLIELAFEIFQDLGSVDDLFRQESCPFPVDLRERLKPGLIQRVLGKDIELVHDLADTDWRVPGPSKRVWQLAINLAGNARQAMQDGGRLEVTSRAVSLSEVEASRLGHLHVVGTPRAGDFVVLTVRDTGRGIPRDALPRVFDLFHSGRNSSGYGLGVVRQIVLAFGGFLGLDSRTEEPERGTRFTIYLPRTV